MEQDNFSNVTEVSVEAPELSLSSWFWINFYFLSALLLSSLPATLVMCCYVLWARKKKDNDGDNQPRALLTEEEYERQGRRTTFGSLWKLMNGGLSVGSADLFREKLSRDSMPILLTHVVLRGALLVLVLFVASSVYVMEPVDESLTNGLNDVLGKGVPQLISLADFWFRTRTALLLLGSVFVVLIGLRSLGRTWLFASSFASFLVNFINLLLYPYGALIFVIILSKFLLRGQEFDVSLADEELNAARAEVIVRGFASIYQAPVIGDSINSTALVAVASTTWLNLDVLKPYASTVTAVAAVLAYSTIRSAFRSVGHASVKLLMLAFWIVVGAAYYMYDRVSVLFPQFIFGFIIMISISMLLFLDSVLNFFTQLKAINKASEIKKHRYPDYEEMNQYMPALMAISNTLSNTQSLVVYVGDEVVRDSGFSLSSLPIFCSKVMWKLLPSLAMKSYLGKWLSVIATHRMSRGESDLIQLVEALNGCNVTVITECVDGNLEQLPPGAKLVELRGNVTHMICSAGHMCEKSVADQCSQGKLICDCGNELVPAICINNAVDDSALHEALGVIDTLSEQGGAMIVLGSCENVHIRELMQNKHANDHVPLMQISRGSIMKNISASVPASPRDVLFEVIGELEE